MMFSNLPGPTHHLRSDLGIGEVAVRLALGKDMPKDDQQASGNGDDRFSRDEALGKTIEFAFPIGVVVHSGPGGFDERGAKVPTAGFGDATLAEGLAGGMDTSAEAGVANELLGGFKTGDIADRGKDGQAQVDAKAGYLEGKSHGIAPLWGIAEAGDLGIQLVDLGFEMIQGFEGMAEEDLFGGREGKRIPPPQVLVGERTAWWKLEHVAVKEAVKAVAGHGLYPNQAAAMSEKATGFPDVEGWNPNLGDEAGGAQFGQLDGVELVGLDAGKTDPRELAGIGDFDPCDEVDDAVIEIPGIGGGFDGDDVRGEKMVAGPIGPFFEGYFEGFEYDFLEGVDGGDIEEVLMKIDAEKPNHT